MPSTTEKQAHFMSAIAHGWHPAGMEHAPSQAVAREFHEADKREGKFMHARGGLAQLAGGVPHGTLSAIAGSGLGGGALHGLSINHPSTMRQILHPHLMMNPHTPGGGLKMPSVKFAEGGSTQGEGKLAASSLAELVAELYGVQGGPVKPTYAEGGDVRSTDFGALTGLHTKYCSGGSSGKYAEGGRVDGAKAKLTIDTALGHLDKGDKDSAIKCLSDCPHAMAHPAVPGIVKHLQGGNYAMGGPVGMAGPQGVQAPPAAAPPNSLLPMLRQSAGSGMPADLSSYYSYGAQGTPSPMQQQIAPSTLQGQTQYPQGSLQAQHLGHVGMGSMSPSALNNPAIRQLLMNVSRGALRSQVPPQALFPGAR